MQRICILQEIPEDKLQVSPVIKDIFLDADVIEAIGGGRYKVNITEEQVKEAVENAEDMVAKEEIERKKEDERRQTEDKIKIPDDLLSIIEGYEDVKDIVIKSLNATSPVHILMIGSPSTAKTIFLMELERMGGRMILGGTSSKVGIRDILLDERPKILLIDEIDKINSGKELSSLLSWMESQRVIVAKSGVYREEKGKGWVFAAGNTKRGLPKELLSRFLTFHFEEYSEEEFIKVCIAVLTKREGTDEELAGYIAVKLALRGYRDVRDSIKIARLSSTKEEVDKIIETMVKYQE